MLAKAKTESASKLVDDMLKGLPEWRHERLSRLRALIKKADPDVVEDVKWRKPSNPDGVPVCSHDGIICIGENLKERVRFTFFKGAALGDPSGLFNARLDSGTSRAIDIYEEDEIDERAFKALVKAAVALNASPKRE